MYFCTRKQVNRSENIKYFNRLDINTDDIRRC